MLRRFKALSTELNTLDHEFRAAEHRIESFYDRLAKEFSSVVYELFDEYLDFQNSSDPMFHILHDIEPEDVSEVVDCLKKLEIENFTYSAEDPAAALLAFQENGCKLVGMCIVQSVNFERPGFCMTIEKE